MINTILKIAIFLSQMMYLSFFQMMYLSSSMPFMLTDNIFTNIPFTFSSTVDNPSPKIPLSVFQSLLAMFFPQSSLVHVISMYLKILVSNYDSLYCISATLKLL